jgi:hypothetical protein
MLPPVNPIAVNKYIIWLRRSSAGVEDALQNVFVNYKILVSVCRQRWNFRAVVSEDGGNYTSSYVLPNIIVILKQKDCVPFCKYRQRSGNFV